MVKIGEHQVVIDCYKQELNDLKDDGAEERANIESDLTKEEVTIKAPNQFHDETAKYWSE